MPATDFPLVSAAIRSRLSPLFSRDSNANDVSLTDRLGGDLIIGRSEAVVVKSFTAAVAATAQGLSAKFIKSEERDRESCTSSRKPLDYTFGLFLLAAEPPDKHIWIK